MMRPEQIKKFCPCFVFFVGRNIKTISTIFLYIFFLYFVAQPKEHPMLSRLCCHSILRTTFHLSNCIIISIPSLFFHLSILSASTARIEKDRPERSTQFKIFSLIALLLKTTFVAVVTVQWWIRPINTFANWDNLKGLLGDRGTRMQTKLKAWQASKDCWSTEFKECYKIK